MSDQQIDAQTRIYRAVEAGQLGEVVDAMCYARRFGTLQWRTWESCWRRTVERYIGGERREAA